MQKIKQSAFHKNNILQQYTCKEFASKLIIKNLITSFHLLFPVKHSYIFNYYIAKLQYKSVLGSLEYACDLAGIHYKEVINRSEWFYSQQLTHWLYMRDEYGIQLLNYRCSNAVFALSMILSDESMCQEPSTWFNYGWNTLCKSQRLDWVILWLLTL